MEEILLISACLLQYGLPTSIIGENIAFLRTFSLTHTEILKLILGLVLIHMNIQNQFYLQSWTTKNVPGEEKM